ncbi:MAG: trypsin-like peptidase domain-containing protein [Deltaproteobacteria bacterium]|nr:trypsin-like peptidase domain-containing protein [Deltaproteobacteria bacterium]NND27396.1 PDZ domain-containing protein [Myxococcales bacterium]MBT8465137.1 trypsin-like peptidase domain-containing protein [Deltaproteobacteria bacterium]MBT8480208.1 trypsin-like peptidase domain-containing protein [Deltaproteobacteria bacterium]NNK06269.1 PDZ domain-containing protein [Myxococcales bacterium]
MFRTMQRGSWLAALGAMLAAITLGTASASPRKGAVDEDALTRAVAFETALTGVAESVSSSVVSIRVEVSRPMNNGLPSFFGGQGQGGIVRGGGSGVILRSDGYILTNNHVVKEATRIDVRLRNGKRYPATLVGADSATDLAMLKIDARGLPQAEFASSERARVGQFVIAIGSPFGLDYTVTTGVLSAKGRGGIGANEIEDYLQTDASINPGNSGGPLVDLQGRVLGINTMIIGRGSGIGFAIPAEIAQRVASQLIASGSVKRAWLGVSFQEITPELAAHFGGDFDGGALVNAVVPGGPADKAGLRSGDVITGVGNQPIREGHDLLRTVLRQGVGERVNLEVRRGGKTKQIGVVTGERPSEDSARASEQSVEDNGMLGLALEELTARLRARVGYEGEGRVFVRAVKPGSDADRAGLRPGDIILQADRQAVRTIEDVRMALRDGKGLLYIERDSQRFFQPLNRSTPR